MRFGFLLKRGKPEAAEIGAELAALLVHRRATVVVTDEDAGTFPRAKAVPPERLGSEIDVLVVLGGDGTFLHGASLVADHGVPLLGINLGSLGFMTHYSLDQARVGNRRGARHQRGNGGAHLRGRTRIIGTAGDLPVRIRGGQIRGCRLSPLHRSPSARDSFEGLARRASQ
jgi:hypothetical protein